MFKLQTRLSIAKEELVHNLLFIFIKMFKDDPMKGIYIKSWILLVSSSHPTSQTKHFYLSRALETFLFIMKKRLSKQKQYLMRFTCSKLSYIWIYYSCTHRATIEKLSMWTCNKPVAVTEQTIYVKIKLLTTTWPHLAGAVNTIPLHLCLIQSSDEFLNNSIFV